MHDLCQRLGLWLARWAGWSEQPLVAAHQAKVASLIEQLDAARLDQDARRLDVLTLQSERTRYREQIAAHLKNVSALDHHVAELQQRLGAKETEIVTLQGLLTATGLPVSETVLARATELISEADTTMIGGEAKRHAVYARLIKDFPDVSKRELAFSIEYALSGKRS